VRVPLKRTTLPRTAEEVAITELRQAIVRGDLPPGTTIKQDATARELGLSVIPVREALKTLTGEGIITYRPQRGYTVAELHPDSVDGIFRVRELLEGEAERIAVRRIGPAGISEMRSAIHEQRKAADARDAVGVIMSNRQFHFALFDLCGNPLLLRYVRQTWDSLDPHRALSYRRAVDRDDTARHVEIDREHEVIVAALETGDPETARRLLAEHRVGGQASFHHYLQAES
jgi:DNA-binding GntR family transcriptional regulator